QASLRVFTCVKADNNCKLTGETKNIRYRLAKTKLLIRGTPDIDITNFCGIFSLLLLQYRFNELQILSSNS
ncbi:MAG: hypothetical protein O4807_00340, partial [Trichodesmium sp. St19_bin2]|nr:hypothetical protein [Trichodesmium sp. St19_bin2]